MASLCTSRDTLVGMTEHDPTAGSPACDARVPSRRPRTPVLPRPRRSLVWRVATPLVGLLSGALFVVSAHSSEGTDLRPGRFTDLASMVRYDATRVDGLKIAGLRPQRRRSPS